MVAPNLMACTVSTYGEAVVSVCRSILSVME